MRRKKTKASPFRTAIAVACAKNDIDLKEAASRAGIAYSSLRNWLEGRYYPSIIQLNCIMRALNIELDVKELTPEFFEVKK